MNPQREMAESGRDTVTSGWFQGTIFPPELRPSRRRTRVTSRVKEPKKSTRESFDFSDFFAGILTVHQTRIPEMTTSGTCARKATLHPQTSLTHPPNIPPKPAPVP